MFAKIYANLVIHELKKVAEVPEKLREDVIDILRQEGYEHILFDQEILKMTEDGEIIRTEV